MTRTRFAPWLVFACIGTLVGCTSGDQGTAGSTELNVVIPRGSTQSGPSEFDIQVVEYTINCTGADFDPTTDPDIDSGDILDQDVQINGVLEVLDTAGDGVTTQDFGPDLTEVYVWQGFMDIPADHDCSVQLRARDGDGEVICTATEPFSVGADATVKVNVLMICDISYQAPVGMLDLDGDFSFNIGNYCPDLFVLNCIDSDIDIRTIPGVGEVAATACQVRFRDADSTCGANCDDQVCTETPEGLSCVPGTDPGVSTVVSCAPTFNCAIPGPLFGTACQPAAGDTCFDLSGGAACVPNAVIDCTGTGTPSPTGSCSFSGDTLGAVGDGPPGPLAPGDGGFFVACVLADDDGNPATPEVPVTPGATVTCQATTTDGDVDCDKTKTVDLTCPGLSPCQIFGGDAACQAAAGTVCVTSVCDDSSGAAVCIDTPVANGTDCSAENPPLASCQGGVCTSEACTQDSDCETPDECTFAGPGICDVGTGNCGPLSNEPAGTSCDGGAGECDGAGVCVDNCDGVVCDDGNECTDDPACVSVGGPICPPATPDDTNTCTTCPSGTCLCDAGACIDGCTVPAPVDAIGIPMACRNAFNQAVSTFPIDLLNVNTNGACIEEGVPVDFIIDPVIALDTAFLQAAAQTLCDLGTFLTQADVTSAQVSMDAIAGATCTQELAVPTQAVPFTVTLDVSLEGSCGSGGTVTVNSGVSVPLTQTTLSCTPGTAGSEVQICSTGTVPLAITLTDPAPPPAYQETYVGVSVGGGAIQVGFACNTSSTTNPPPGQENEIGCVLANPTASTPTGESCAQAVGDGDVGETPYPTSDCNTEEGPPTNPQTCIVFGSSTPCIGTCDTVPVGVDPSAVCATFNVQ